ncbi:macro domain-containing protein [bacterium]|nr:macro domain-containing protein [bacterium]
MILGSGVAGAIRQADDGTIQAECNRTGRIRLGGAAITSGGATGIRYVIHAAGMHQGSSASVDSVRMAVRNSLKKAKGKEIKSVSFPAIGAGIGGVSMELCAEVSIEEVRNHLAGETSLKEVRFVLFDNEALKIFEEIYERLLPSGD